MMTDERSAAQLAPMRRRGDWFRMVENKAEDRADIWIYDEIGPWYAITAKDFIGQLRDVKSSTIGLHLHSPGGEVFDSIAIYRALLDHPARVDVQVDALAASSATIIAMAGDRIVMSRHARMMIHEPYGLLMGTAEDARDLANRLDDIGDEIASIYQERAGGSVAAWRQKMAAETWFTDQQAVDAGLADEIGAAASRVTNSFDLSRFAHVPEELLAAAAPPASTAPERTWTKRETEQALREAGLSRTLARTVVDHGWPEREAPPDPRSPLSPFRVQLEVALLDLT